MNLLRYLPWALLALGLGGCATDGDPRDPLEPMNRAIYGFNEGVDKVVLKPLAHGYVKVVPTHIRAGVRNVFSNLDDITVVSNDLLQLKLRQGSGDLLRLTFNTTFGILGLLDVSTEMGLPKHSEDFGQTMGYWGMGDGAYLVLPFFGPSSVRDGIGLAIEWTTTDLVATQHDVAARNAEGGLRMVNRRADLIDTLDVVDKAALDPYEFMRDLYLERRRSLVYDGKPPKEE